MPGELIYIDERDPVSGMPLRQGVAFRASRASPRQVNRLSSQDRTREGRATTAAGSLIPIVYGRVRLAPPRGGHVYALGDLSGDLVLGISWCLGTVNAIEEVQLNDGLVPGGITLTHYIGDPTQTVDPTLAAAIAGYDDRLVISAGGEQWGLAHTVARVQPAALDGWPRFAAIIQGRRVFDPRDANQDPADPSTWAYSANPALCAADLASSRAYGMGHRVLGLADAADRCDDEVQAGEARMSLGLALTEPRSGWEYVQQLLRYAQCYYSWEGDALRLIPDRPVMVPVATITAADFVGDSLDARPRDISRLPNLVEVLYSVPTDDPIPWGETPATAQTAGVESGAVLPSQLTLRMPGIHRPGEATRVAQQELARLRVEMDYSWTMYADGLLYQTGDLVRLLIEREQIDREVRITRDPDRLDGGRYRLTGESYSDALYSDAVGDPDDPLPEGFEIPDGLIVIWDSSASAPAGWTVYSTADGRWILGAGGSIDPGDTGGGGAVAVSGATSVSAHDESPAGATYGSTGAFGSGPTVTSGGGSVSHGHSYDSGSATPKARHWSRRLIQRTGGATTDPLPQHAAMLALELLGNPSITLASPAGELLLRADSANSQDASNSVSVSGGTTGASGSHRHGTSFALRADTVGPSLVVLGFAGDHAHTYGSLTLTSAPVRVRCGLYKGTTGAYNYVSGLIGFWAGSLASIPEGWELVADLTDKLIELHGSALGNAAGNDTASWTGVTSTGGAHSHHASTASGDASSTAGHASSKDDHAHSISGSASWRPEWFALAAIRFVGSE